MRSVDQILDDALKYGKVKNDASLARELGVKANTVSMWRKRNIFDYALLVTWCEQRDIPTAWILTGQVTVKAEPVGDLVVTRPTSEPGLYRQDSAFRQMMVNEGVLVTEPGAARYGKESGRAPLKPEVNELVRYLIDILESDDTVMKRAITENLKAFKEAVDRKARLNHADVLNDLKSGQGRTRGKHRSGGRDGE